MDVIRNKIDELFGNPLANVDVTPIEQWDEPMPGEFRKMTPTLGDEILFMGILHLAIHIGQMTSSRRCLNHQPRF